MSDYKIVLTFSYDTYNLYDTSLAEEIKFVEFAAPIGLNEWNWIERNGMKWNKMEFKGIEYNSYASKLLSRISTKIFLNSHYFTFNLNTHLNTTCSLIITCKIRRGPWYHLFIHFNMTSNKQKETKQEYEP